MRPITNLQRDVTSMKKEMAELKRLLKHETDVYEYAKEHYYDQWDRDLLTC